MHNRQSSPRYNHAIPRMRARTSSGLRLGWLTPLLLAIILPSSLFASGLEDAARQLARKIAASSGPGAFGLEITNRSSLDDKSVREVRAALEAALHVEGVHNAKADHAIGTIEVVLSESLRDYVWTAQIAIGSDEKKVALVALPRPPSAAPLAKPPAIVLKATLLFGREQVMLDVAQVDMPGGSRLLVLGDGMVSIYRSHGQTQAGRWELEASLPIVHSHPFPRDLRGRLLLRRDHLFDVYLPGTFCRSTGNSGVGLTLACNGSDDPWPLASEDGALHAFFAAARNFFTGAVSPGIGQISNVPSFYSAAALPRSSYTLWAFAAVDGSLHLVDGITDQLIRGRWGSDLVAVHSACGAGTQLLSSGSGNSDGDSLRAFEVPDREPVAVSSALEVAGGIVALWPESAGNGAVTIVKRKDTGWYEAYRVSIACGN